MKITPLLDIDNMVKSYKYLFHENTIVSKKQYR